MHKTSTKINKSAIIIIYYHGTNFVTFPKVKTRWWFFFLFANYTIHRRHSQRRHTHPYEYTHANPTPRSIFEDCAGKSSRLTKSPQAPRCRRERRLPLKAQTSLKHEKCAPTGSRTQDLRCYRGSCPLRIILDTKKCWCSFHDIVFHNALFSCVCLVVKAWREHEWMWGGRLGWWCVALAAMWSILLEGTNIKFSLAHGI
jgi:hypothetical protein